MNTCLPCVEFDPLAVSCDFEGLINDCIPTHNVTADKLACIDANPTCPLTNRDPLFPKKCLSCDPGFYLDEVNGFCYPCGDRYQKCETCDYSVCSTCQDSYELDYDSLSCVTIPQNCGILSSFTKSICLYCDIGYVLT